MRRTIWAARIAALLAMAAAGPAAQARPTEAQAFCHDLKRLVRAAGHDSGFAALERSRANPPTLGFRPQSCRAHAATATLPPAYWCQQTLAPDHLALDHLAAMTAACLPEAKRVKADWREALFEAPGVRILITEWGGPRAKVGRIAGYRVEAVGAE